MQLGKQIAQRMKQLGITQRQLGKKTGLTQQAISKYVRDKTRPSYEVILKLSKELAVPPGWFFPDSESVPQRELWGDAPKPASGDIIVFPSSGKITRGGTFVIGHFCPMQDFPHPTRVRSSGIITNFYDLIFNKLAEELPHGQIRGTLAVNWKPMEKRWVFQLREGVKFHDGKPLTAADVKWSYQRYLEQNPQESRIEAVEALNRRFIAIHLTSPCQLQELAMPFILPEGTTDSPTEWVGTGPFQPVELHPGFWRLIKNPDYFLSTPYFDEIQVREYPDVQALERALINGEVHFAIQVNHPGENFVAKTEPAAVRYHLHFMLNEPLVQNRALRQAIALALDIEALAKAAGSKNPLYSSGPFDYIRGDRWHAPPPPQPEAAIQFLKQVPNFADPPFRVQYSENVPEHHPVAELIVNQLKEIGIPAEIGDPAHARLLVRSVGTLEREYAMWQTSGLHNFNGYSSSEVDQRIQRYENTAVTPDQLLALRRLIQRDLPDIPLFYLETPLTYVKQLRALDHRMVLLRCLNEIHTWYLDEEIRAEGVKVREAQQASLA
ncbi:MAG: ABC transporter substrate-binding protein [Candidatus Poribacteria bacterium]|nr:ABC transporter substrate-binding protein [Candidatus Poribacteria bacterium]